MNESKLTEPQRLALDFMKGFEKLHGRFPTIRQIGTGLGMVVSGAHHHVVKLRDKGYITRLDQGAYSYTTVPPLGESVTRMAFITGFRAAGQGMSLDEALKNYKVE